MFPSTSSSSGLSVPASRSHSSLSAHRPLSSASTRPLSRLSARPHSRQARSRFVPLCQTLVTQVTGLDDKENDGDVDGRGKNYRAAVDFAVKNLEATMLSKGAAGVDMSAIDRQIQGHALKARINSQDELGEALQAAYEHLKARIDEEHDLDQEITKSRLPDHLQFLIRLSSAPSPHTILHASTYLHALANPPAPRAPLTWAAILSEEPFEGEHWDGVYGLPAGSIRRPDGVHKGGYDREKESERLDWDSRWSTPSLSPLNSEDLELDEDDDDPVSVALDSDDTPAQGPGPSTSRAQGTHQTYAHRRVFEALQEKQYWREGWRGHGGPGQAGKAEFDIGDASTLGPALRKILRPSASDKTRASNIPFDALLQNEKYIHEEDAVREVLMALQGRRNIVLEWTEASRAIAEEGGHGWGAYVMTKMTPHLAHLSLAAQASMLSSLACVATTVRCLRDFVSSVFEQARNRHKQEVGAAALGRRPGTTRTLEAFADAVGQEIAALDRWCVRREEAMCRAWGGAGVDDATSDHDADERPHHREHSLVISLLGTEKAFRDAFRQTFEVLLDVVEEVYPGVAATTVNRTKGRGRPRSAAAASAALLDRLFASVQEHLERRDGVTGRALLRVFAGAAEPVWGMVGRWLRDGMGLGLSSAAGVRDGGVGNRGGGRGELDDEFFIESSGLGLGMMGLGLLDPEFWREGYALREGVIFEYGDGDEGGGDGVQEEKKRKTIPLFLEHVAQPVLGAGKAVGLLRALGVPLPILTPGDGLGGWQSFGELVGLSPVPLLGTDMDMVSERKISDEMPFAVSIDTLSRLVYDGLWPYCDVVGSLLARVLVEECALWAHLGTIEDLFLMRRGDLMSHFTDVLFAKMDTQQSWGDFHFLNTAFKDVVEASNNAGAKKWMQTSLVRLSYRGSKDRDKAISRTVKAIDGLAVEYAVPFPLTYIFQPATLQVYGEIFVFLLQIRRAKRVLERILVRGDTSDARGRGWSGKVFYAMRSRLSWFVNTLLNFLTTYVIHSQILKFHEEFQTAKSLDEMVQIHDAHLGKLQGRCLLKPNTSALHRAILSILDMCLHFGDFFVAYAGDTTATHDVSRQSMSVRRHRSGHQRRQRRDVIGFSLSLRDRLDSSDEDSGGDAPEPSFSIAASSFPSGESGFAVRMDKMSSELEGLVRFLRRGVESLAGGVGEAAPAFGVLAFALEDWDN